MSNTGLILALVVLQVLLQIVGPNQPNILVGGNLAAFEAASDGSYQWLPAKRYEDKLSIETYLSHPFDLVRRFEDISLCDICCIFPRISRSRI